VFDLGSARPGVGVAGVAVRPIGRRDAHPRTSRPAARHPADLL